MFFYFIDEREIVSRFTPAKLKVQFTRIIFILRTSLHEVRVGNHTLGNITQTNVTVN